MKENPQTDQVNKEKEQTSSVPTGNISTDNMSTDTTSEQELPHEADRKDQSTEERQATIIEEECKKALEKAQADLAAANDKYVRLYAEFENFRKRTAQEKLALIETAGEKLLHELLPIIDDFERALASLTQKNVNLQAVEEGIKLIHDKMVHFLEQAGVQPMQLQKGSDFNAEFHEAIAKTPVKKAELKGKIIDIIEKGYLLKNKVLRYAKVIIGE